MPAPASHRSSTQTTAPSRKSETRCTRQAVGTRLLLFGQADLDAEMKNFARLEDHLQKAYPNKETMRAQKPDDLNAAGKPNPDWHTTLKDVKQEKIYEFELMLNVRASREASAVPRATPRVPCALRSQPCVRSWR